MSETLNSKRILSWAAIFGFPLIILLIPTTDAFTYQNKMFLAITLWTVLMFAFELVDTFIPCIVMPMLYMMTGVAGWDLAFAGWQKSIPWQVLGIFLLVNALVRNGLLKRVAYICILKTSCTYRGLLWGMYLFGLVVNIFIPGGSSVAMATFAYGVCNALNLKQSNTAAGIMLAGAMGLLMPGLFIYVPGNFGLLVSVASSVDPSITMNLPQYFMHNAIFIPFGFLMVFVIEKVFKPEQQPNGKEYFRQELKALGKMSRDERLSAVGLIVIFLYLVTNGITGWELAYVFILVPAVLSLPAFNVVTTDDIKNINFKFVFFIASCMTIGFVASGIGISQLVATIIIPFMQNLNSYGVIALTWLTAVLVNFLLTPLAAMASFGTPLTEIATSLSINPYPLLYAFNNGLDQVLFPYEYAIYLIYFSFGLIRIKDFIKFFGIKMGLNFLFIMIAAVPYWKFIGLL